MLEDSKAFGQIDLLYLMRTRLNNVFPDGVISKFMQHFKGS